MFTVQSLKKDLDPNILGTTVSIGYGTLLIDGYGLLGYQYIRTVPNTLGTPVPSGTVLHVPSYRKVPRYGRYRYRYLRRKLFLEPGGSGTAVIKNRPSRHNF